MTLLEAATIYLKLKFSVIPLNGKEPLIPWIKYQTEMPTEEEVKYWFTELKPTGIGIVTGRISNIVVVDIENGGSSEGLTDTAKVLTGGGGFHYYYKYPNVPIKNSVKKVRDLVDIRSDGGYVVAPPSLHPLTGKEYEWLDGPETEFSELPNWIIEKSKTERTKKDWKKISSGVQEGERNNSAASYIGKFLSNFSQDEWEDIVWPTIVDWNKNRNQPPLDENELRRIFESIADEAVNNSDSVQRDTIKKEEIVELITDELKILLFHDKDKEGYAKIKLENGYGIYKITGNEFRRYLSYQVWQKFKVAISRDTQNTVIGLIEGKAVHEGAQYNLHLRTAWINDSLWYDLGLGRAVKITGSGWEIIPDAPIIFRNLIHQEQQADPIPAEAKDMEDVFKYMNLNEDPGLRCLMAVYLCGILLPDVPRPVLAVHGQQGSAKSTLLRVIKKLLDPSAVELLTYPKSSVELIQQLSHHYLVFFDNISEIKESLSDDLCRACTGQAYTKRRLYTDDDDVIYHYKRAVAINGINLVAQKPDLLDRSLIYELQPITKEGRIDESSFWLKFEENKPKILGSIFTILSKAMAIKESIILERKPRLADFAMWGCAIAEALGYGKEKFLNAYEANIDKQNSEALNASPVAQLVMAFMEDRDEWKGSAKILLDEFTKIADAHGLKKEVPKSVNWLWRRIKEVKANLNTVGIDAYHDDSDRPRRIVLTNSKYEDLLK